MRIRPIDPRSSAEIELVAQRMRQTLVEVLGKKAGEAMYSLDWLCDRVRFHLDPDRSTGAVFLAEDEKGAITGHCIVRVEPDPEEGQIGLFSTTYVVPEARRRGVALRLLRAGEAWMVERGLRTAVTYTDVGNEPLQRLYLGQGYELSNMPNSFVALRKPLGDRRTA